MNPRDLSRCEMFGQVVAFGHATAAEFSPASEAKKRFNHLEKLHHLLGMAADIHPPGNVSRASLMNALWLDLQNIARTAGAINQDHPGFADRFPIPSNGDERGILAAATAYLAELESTPLDDKHTQLEKAAVHGVFTAKEMPEDFVERLRADYEALSSTRAKPDPFPAAHPAYTEFWLSTIRNRMESGEFDPEEKPGTVERLIRHGLKEVTYLDAIIHNKFVRNPDLLGAWEHARQIKRSKYREEVLIGG